MFSFISALLGYLGGMLTAYFMPETTSHILQSLHTTLTLPEIGAAGAFIGYYFKGYVSRRVK